jgi:hypothetical protein
MGGFYPLFPEAPNEWLGNIWVVSVETGETRQVTQIQQIKHQNTKNSGARGCAAAC